MDRLEPKGCCADLKFSWFYLIPVSLVWWFRRNGVLYLLQQSPGLGVKILDISRRSNYCQLHWSAKKSPDWNFVRAPGKSVLSFLSFCAFFCLFFLSYLFCQLFSFFLFFFFSFLCLFLLLCVYYRTKFKLIIIINDHAYFKIVFLLLCTPPLTHKICCKT